MPKQERLTFTPIFVCLVFISAVLATAQDTPKSIALTDKSNVPADNISKALQKECPNISIVKDATKSDYGLEALKTNERTGLRMQVNHEFDLTLFDHDGNTFSSLSDESLNRAVKTLCHTIKTSVMVEVVDLSTLTQSTDARNDGGLINAATGRRTHTDTDSIYVIVNNEHALLDCYERASGCKTIGTGKYYGERKDDGIWVSYRMPITHKPVRNHYKIAGTW